jgi:REP element-mobilizing transposase RayT
MDTGHAALRRGRQSVNGQAYLVTFTTARRKPHFRSDVCAIDACRLLGDPALWGQSRLLSWVLMPDHWHGIIEVGACDELSACVRRLKGRTAFELGRRHPSIHWRGLVERLSRQGHPSRERIAGGREVPGTQSCARRIGATCRAISVLGFNLDMSVGRG